MDTSALKSLLTDARKRLSSPFCCGGSFQPPQPIRLAFEKNGGAGSELYCMELPAKDGDTMDMLVAACTEASFGKGMETVYDPTYRKSLKLESNDFLTSFELHSSQILEDVKRMLAPSTDFITAQLYKLNVYRPGDFFKPHVDTPRLNAFASLVLSLPTEFTGGELVVEHKGHAHCFDWSRGDAGEPKMLHWAAFYSDCKHEVKEVTSGYRIVLTYNLYQNGGMDGIDIDIKSCIENAELTRILCRAKESYKGDGVTLGFPCSHLYPLLLHCKNHQRSVTQQLHMLKGEDLLLYAAAQSAGLEPRLCRIWQAGYVVNDDNDDLVYFIDKNFDGIPTPDCYLEDEDSSPSIAEFLNFLGDRSSDIEWCSLTDFKNFNWQVGGAYGSYGNEASSDTLYCIIAILIDFKESCKKRKTVEDKDEDPRCS